MFAFDKSHAMSFHSPGVRPHGFEAYMCAQSSPFGLWLLGSPLAQAEYWPTNLFLTRCKIFLWIGMLVSDTNRILFMF